MELFLHDPYYNFVKKKKYALMDQEFPKEQMHKGYSSMVIKCYSVYPISFLWGNLDIPTGRI